MRKGITLALTAYIFWGIHPIYWKLLSHVPAIEILSHRIVWSLTLFSIIVSFRKEWSDLKTAVSKAKNKWIIFTPAFLIGSNWGLYIWAVNAGFIVETSLAYFVSPLLTVFLGVVFLHESLRRIQWIAIAVVALGVLFMTIVYGEFPWISAYLAGTWGIYGLLRKQSPLSPIQGLTVEASVLSVFAITYMIVLGTNGTSTFLYYNLSTDLLLIGCGITSGLPLLIFITAAKMIPLSLIGILQYIYPTTLFFLGVFIYGEPMSETKLIGFVFIWIALLIYSFDSVLLIPTWKKKYLSTVKIKD